MKFILGSDPAGKDLKEILRQFLSDNSYEVIDVTGDDAVDFVDASKAVVREVKKSDDRYGIIVDAYGAGPFMTVTRIKGVIAADTDTSCRDSRSLEADRQQHPEIGHGR